jgi:hypothetical protein
VTEARGPVGAMAPPPPSTLKKIKKKKKKKIITYFAYWPLAIIFFLAPWPIPFYHLVNWFHLIWNDSFIVKTFSSNISLVATDMFEKSNNGSSFTKLHMFCSK